MTFVQYLVVKNMEEAEYVASYIANGGNKEEFMEKFKNAMSKGFDPDKVSVRVGGSRGWIVIYHNFCVVLVIGNAG